MTRREPPSPPWSPVPARAGDLAEARALVVAAALPPDGLEEHFPGGYAVVRGDSRLVGVAGLEVHGDHGLLRSVAVSAELRGRGLGAALVRDRLERARALGLRSVHLLTTTAPGFFRGLGFAEIARADVPEAIRGSREFAAVCPDSAVVLALRLS